MASTYLIDGYNLIHYEPKLKQAVRSDFEGSRDALAALIIAFCGATGHRAKIIFDGRGRHPQSMTPALSGEGVEVIYGSGHLSADAVIERMVYQAPDPQQFIVVSGDRGIIDTCQHMGAFIMRPENFLRQVHEAQTDMKRAVEERTGHGAAQFGDRLDDTSLERLKAIKKRLDRNE